MWLASNVVQDAFTSQGFQTVAVLLEENTLLRIHGGIRWWKIPQTTQVPASLIQPDPFLWGLIVTQGPTGAPDPPSASFGIGQWLHWESIFWRAETAWRQEPAAGPIPITYVVSGHGPSNPLDIEANRRIQAGNTGILWLVWGWNGPAAEEPDFMRADFWFRVLILTAP